MTQLQTSEEIDPFVQEQVPYTNGFLYLPLQFKLPRYPIPDLRLEPATGERFLDIGCNWGRWSIAASRKGYCVSGIDPSPPAVLAAMRVAAQLKLDIDFRSGSGEIIPYPDETFDVVFSYSVLQHLAKERVRATIVEIDRVLKPGGVALVQMPNWLGLRCLYHQAKRGFRAERNFEVRYWSLRELRDAFSTIGTVDLSVDGFFGLGTQATDIDLMPPGYRATVRASETLRRIVQFVPPLMYAADSVYVTAQKSPKSASSMLMVG
jgi:2-polyprenyl-3-methyl-5-hydroxy-6-metoxy-1,4-benzoquinol methylase